MSEKMQKTGENIGSCDVALFLIIKALGNCFYLGESVSIHVLISIRFCTTLLLHGTSQTINKLHTNKAITKTIIVKNFYLFISITQFLEKLSNKLRK